MDRRHQSLLLFSGGVSDTTAPTVAITSAVASPSFYSTIAVTITFSEAVTGFVVGDITIGGGGSLASFATADNITFTVDWTLATGANTLNIGAGVCKDAAGNDNTAATQYSATYLVLQPAAAAGLDAMIASAAPTYNYGARVNFFIGEEDGSVGAYRTLIKFDLSSIPAGSSILSSILSLYALTDASSNARTYRVYRQKRAWQEGDKTGAPPDTAGATWNKYDITNNWQTAGGFGADDCEQTDIGSRAFTATEAVNEFKDFTLTPSAIQSMLTGGAWTNNGFLIKADTESNDMYTFASSDNATASNRPKLSVVYSANP